MTWKPIYGLLMMGLTIANYFIGLSMAARPTEGKARKRLMVAGIWMNVLALCYFKYAYFCRDSANGILSLFHFELPKIPFDIILPLGISFFVFEFIHYLVDVYRGSAPVKNFMEFALFPSFFPTQIAGPIKRYPDFVAQMQAETKLKLSYFDEGIPLIIIGMAKKLLLADNLATFVQMGVSAPSIYSGPELWLFAYAFAFQIYFDFSGYTDIGRGSAMLFGYHIPLNFNMPYIARNMSDFWRRWHISLSSWLRDYLFIPLGGSKGSRWQTNRNLFLTMALGGLWHGASWNFVIWGVYHGLALIVHREFSQWRSTQAWLVDLLKQPVPAKVWHYTAMLFTFHAVCIGWVFFRIQNIGAAFTMVRRMVTLRPFFSMPSPEHFLVMKPDLPVVVPVVMVMVAILMIANWPVSSLNEKG
ncbi:MAG: hypothetical protein B7W98_02675, partial [Parcubacteria group bacterium 20-58-5]